MTKCYDIPQDDGKFYVNMGRDLPTRIVGPFDTAEIAQAYIDTLDWRGAKPTVATLTPPLPEKMERIANVQLTLTKADYEAVLHIVGNDQTDPRRFDAYLALADSAKEALKSS